MLWPEKKITIETGPARADKAETEEARAEKEAKTEKTFKKDLGQFISIKLLYNWFVSSSVSFL